VRRACGLNFHAGIPNTPKLTGKDGGKWRFAAKIPAKSRVKQALWTVAKELH
jgi:hypothetical protein